MPGLFEKPRYANKIKKPKNNKMNIINHEDLRCPNCLKQITTLFNKITPIDFDGNGGFPNEPINKRVECGCGCAFITLEGRWVNNDDLPFCRRCKVLMRPVVDNVGFTAPDPEKIIITGFVCNECGITIDD